MTLLSMNIVSKLQLVKLLSIFKIIIKKHFKVKSVNQIDVVILLFSVASN